MATTKVRWKNFSLLIVLYSTFCIAMFITEIEIPWRNIITINIKRFVSGVDMSSI